MDSEQGQQQLKSLAADVDIVIENFKVGGVAKYGLDYQSLAAINPRLIYCSITGFGQDGPMASRPGYDFLVQAMGGLMSVTGVADGEAGAGPQKVGVALTDIMTGLYATIGILAALNDRQQSGLGQYIDLALLDVTAATLANQASNFLVGGKTPTRLGNAHPNIVPYQSFVVADGHCIVAIGNDTQFKRYVEVLGLAELAIDAAYATNEQRVMNRNHLVPLLQRRMLDKNRDQWLAEFADADVPAGPINTIDEVFEHPQILARKMKIDIAHPLNDHLGLVANPIKLSRTPAEYILPPPMLGEHTEQILALLNKDGCKPHA
jgi:crotonobetainyl-CoA:carnitine CoA-transferase CaiB-like acyl-CoA transferase